MTLDSNSLKKLSEFNKNLSNTSKPKHALSKENTNLKSTLHPIETEENPQELFKQLMKASPNGEVPAHLVKRLKELENRQQKEAIDSLSNCINEINLNTLENSNVNRTVAEPDLYTTFKMLLLEEDEKH